MIRKEAHIVIKARKKLLFLVGCMALLLIGTCYAFWSGQIAHTNQLKADEVTAEIQEVFQQDTVPTGSVQKKVSFRNDSTSSVFLRVCYAETWQATEDDKVILLNNQVNGSDVAVKNWKNGFGEESSLWSDGGDGWFYYKKVLEPGAETENILEEVTFPDYTGEYVDYRNADYQLYFRMEILQLSDSQSTLNSSEVNQAASTTVFGKEAMVNGDSVAWE